MPPLSSRLLGLSTRALFSLPPAVLGRMLGPAPRNDRGHPLDPQTQLLVWLAARLRPTHDRSRVALMRQKMDAQASLVDVPPVPLHRVEDLTLPVPGATLRARLYTPRAPDGTPRPLCVFFHGGGWVQGSLVSHDGVCRLLAQRAGCLVLAVDYRMAPEHPFPTAPRDALAAFRWVVAHAGELGVDPARIAVAGDSAGGNLAAVVAREEGTAVCFQLLVYPATDLTRSHTSHRTYAHGFLLEKEGMDFFLACYLDDPARQERDPLGSPLWADVPPHLAPAYVLTAGFDPLRDEGEAYAAKLQRAGVPVEAVCEERLIHGFFSMGGAVDAARAAVERAADSLARGLRARSAAPATERARTTEVG
ncbi:alpha/beta hydrolase [Archangium sp.]|uniref:alpha/beta hydrolase n=1 Tax=Archangium sp. TaxID=1872627 RepID=UPI002ED8C756